MSRIEDAWKVQRSLERGEPQPTAMTTNMTPEQGREAMMQYKKQISRRVEEGMQKDQSS
jgi:hypothetical protein